MSRYGDELPHGDLRLLPGMPALNGKLLIEGVNPP
jgi:hypothetical protein